MDTHRTAFVLLVLASLQTNYAEQTPAPTPAPTPPNNTSVDTENSSTLPTTTTTTPAPPEIIKVVTLLDPPFVMHTDRGKSFTGLAVEVLQQVMSNLNKNYSLDIPDGGIPQNQRKYGWEDSLSSFDELVGQVYAKKSDMAIGAFTLTSSLATQVSVSQPIMHSGYRLLYKIPESWHPGEAMVTLLRPFSPGLWVLIIFMTTLASVMLYIIGRFSPYEDIAFVGKTSTYEGLTMQNSFLYTYSTLMWQGYTAAPKSISGRILVCIWWLFSIMALAAYIAGLCVLLFRVNPEIRTLPFSNMDEFARQAKVDMLVVANSSSHNFLQNSPRPLHKRLLLKLKKENIITGDVESAVKKMMDSDGMLAVLLESSVAQYLATQEPCDKMVVGEKIGDHSIGFICQNGSDLCKNLDLGILKLKEEGRVDELKIKYLEGGCLANKGKSYIFEGLPFFDTFGGDPDAIMPLTITITRFSSAFIILVIGIGLSGISLAVEIYWSKKRGSPVPQRINRGGDDDDTERIRNDYRDEIERA
ncbi:hypothetical protein Btru_031614 [Bulinus truncatus]|nr:hypothetical protein Btru_031614 [Bulinus truncatus]